MVDYYEFLQISPNADLETIHRVYRFLAARLHPDNPGSGDSEQFRLLKAAHDVLSDKRRRIEYDEARRRRTPEPFSSSIDFMDSLEGELNRRMAVLAVLYRRRRVNVSFAEVSLAEIEEQMGFPRDYRDFTLWYLQKKGYIARADNAQFELTADGVDYVEAQRSGLPNLHRMLTSGMQPTAEEIENINVETAPAAQVRPAPPASPSGPIILPSSMDKGYERRAKKSDRRVGAPDVRKNKIERRNGPIDRRALREAGRTIH